MAARWVGLMIRSFRVALTAAASLVLLAAGQAPDQKDTAPADSPRLQLAAFTPPAGPTLATAPTLDAAVVTDDEALADADGQDQPEVHSLGNLVEAINDLPEIDLSDDLRCLASAVYYESKGEPLEGQLAVAQVILNRIESGRYADNACDVIRQPGQFSFVRRGRIRTPADNPNWRTAQAIAVIAATNNWREIVGDATFFHATRVAPGWRGMRRVSQIGNHIFYALR